MTKCLQTTRCIYDEEALDSDLSYSRSTSSSANASAKLIASASEFEKGGRKCPKVSGRKCLKHAYIRLDLHAVGRSKKGELPLKLLVMGDYSHGQNTLEPPGVDLICTMTGERYRRKSPLQNPNCLNDGRLFCTVIRPGPLQCILSGIGQLARIV